MGLALAIISSNQDSNHPPAGFPAPYNSYSEAGGCRIIADKVAAQGGPLVRHFAPANASADRTEHAALYATFGQAKTWLTLQAAAGHKVAAIHIHTNAAGTSAQGTSHTGYCWSNDGITAAESKALGAACAGKVGAVLGLPVVTYEYTDWLYDQLLEPHPSTLLEVTRHDRLADLQALYAQVDGIARAILDGALAWAGGGASEVDTLRRQLAEKEAQLVRYRAACQQARDVLAAVLA